MYHQIDPTVDCVFKAILGSVHHQGLLINFINAILGYEGEGRVVDVELLNPFNEKDNLRGKLTCVDVKVKDGRGRQFQIEIQTCNHASLAERILFTWAALFAASIQEGQFYLKLEPVISIWLLTENLFPEIDLVHIPFAIYSPEAKIYLSQYCGIHVLQLKKWPQSAKIEDHKSRWIALFRYGKNIDPDNPPYWMETIEMIEALGIMKGFSEKGDNYHLYLSRLDQHILARTIAADREQNLARLGQTQAKLGQTQAELAQEKAEKEKTQTELAKERAEKEQAQTKNERLLTLLQKAGIDPNLS